MSRSRAKDGSFVITGDEAKDAEVRREEAAKEHGYTVKKENDYAEEMQYQLEKAGLYKDVKVNEFGFGKDFLNFLHLGKGNNYNRPLNDIIQGQLTGDSQNFYTPLDDFYGSSPGGGDMVHDYGRIPVNHLMILCAQRLGIANRACNGTASDVYRNRFDFVKDGDPDTVVKKPEIFTYMRKSLLWDKLVDELDFCLRTGLGHLVPYYKGEKDTTKMDQKAPESRPYKWDSFSAYWMTPNNLHDLRFLDYDKQRWNFVGGIHNVSNIHHSRVHVLELFRVEGGLRGGALPELCWTPLMCYLNTMYYVLKGLGQLGTHYLVFNSAKEYPTPTETQAYINLANLMRANKTIVLGKNASFTLENSGGKIGSGIEHYMEFLREDISSAWIIPKNQLFGRSDGGGLDGAGALISKEDYLASNLSTKQLATTNDLMFILEKMCGFPGLEEVTIRWNLDLHKTQEQRYKEELMEEQLNQAKTQTKMGDLNLKLFKEQSKLQIEMAKVQQKMMKEDPEQFMEESSEDEENLDKKKKPEKTKDFISLSKVYDMYMEQYMRNDAMLKMINGSMRNDSIVKLLTGAR
jgi:hypothetical protein